MSELEAIDLNIDEEFVGFELTSHKQNFLSADVDSKTPLFRIFYL